MKMIKKLNHENFLLYSKFKKTRFNNIMFQICKTNIEVSVIGLFFYTHNLNYILSSMLLKETYIKSIMHLI